MVDTFRPLDLGEGGVASDDGVYAYSWTRRPPARTRRIVTTTREDCFAGLCDDAALFPPGNLPLADAVPAHVEHLAAAPRLVGPFVVSAGSVPALGPLLAGADDGSFEVAMTVPLPTQLTAALAVAARCRSCGSSPSRSPPRPATDSRARWCRPWTPRVADRPDLDVFVELPRDERRAAVLAALAGTPYRAKLRTGGVRAELYPDEHELAAAVVACLSAGVAFKATAGLHHAVRNTDPATGFEQHGFLNLLAAVDAAQRGAATAEVAALLAERDATALAGRVAGLQGRADVRSSTRSAPSAPAASPSPVTS